MKNPLLKKKATSVPNDPAILSVAEERDYARLEHKMNFLGETLTPEEKSRWNDYQIRTRRDQSFRRAPIVTDGREIVDAFADFPDREYPVSSPKVKRMLRPSPVYGSKKATSLNLPGEGVGGIDLTIRENAENAGNPRAEEPLEPPATKGVFACAKCGAEYPDGNDLVNHAQATGHDPVEEEIQDAEFFKESEDGIDVQAATQSYGPIPPMGANPPKPPVPPTPPAPVAPAPGKPPVTPTPGEKVPPQPASPGKPMTKEQADALNALTQTASVNKVALPWGAGRSGPKVKHTPTPFQAPAGSQPLMHAAPGPNESWPGVNRDSKPPEAGRAPYYGGPSDRKSRSVFPDEFNFPDNPRYSGHFTPPLEDSPEWGQTRDALRKLPVGDQLQITLSVTTLRYGNGKPVKSVLQAFGNHLLRALTAIGRAKDFRVSVNTFKQAVIVTHLPLSDNPQVHKIGQPLTMTNNSQKLSADKDEVPGESFGEVSGETGEEHFEEKLIHLQQVNDEAIPMSVMDFELLRKFTGSPSFHIDDLDEVHNKVVEHGYSLEVVLNPDEGFGKEAGVTEHESIEMHETPQLGAPNPGAQRHIDRREQQAITDSIDKPVQHRIGTEVEEHETTSCPNCSSKSHNVVDEEEGEKLIECSDCGSFFTI